GHFCPRSVDRLYVLGPSADVPRSVAERLLRPDVSESLGRVLGKEAARAAGRIAFPSDVRWRETLDQPVSAGDVREILTGLRPTDRAARTISLPEVSVPVLAEVDVVIVGGGTTGACAAIGAARRGADVLVVEYQEGLGGVGTVGLIGRPYHGRNLGFTKEVPFCDKEHNTEYKMEWFRREIRKAGGKIWLGVLGCGAFVEGDRVKGAVVATTLGRGVVLADVVIDATGNADVAIAAGAGYMYGGGPHEIALQGTGLPMRPLGNTYVNTDYLLVDESDLVDTWRALVGVRLATNSDAYDVGTFIQTRERRRVVGDHVLSYLDQIAGRTYPDSIVLSGSDYDSHGYPSEPFFALIPHTERTLKANHPAPGGTCDTPYRCLLPRGLEGILVTGLAVSMHRDASAMVRMQKDMHNQGYAAGVAAAMAVKGRCTPRQIDVKSLQRHLVEIDNLPARVLTDEDSFPLPQKEIDAAVAQLTDGEQRRNDVCRALAIVLSHRKPARPALREAFQSAEGDARLSYAKLLGFLGEREGVPVLVDALEQVDAWDAKILQGNMAEYAHLPTPIDALILALGYSGDPRATAPILKKLETLDADLTLSHHRAVALALEHLGDPSAALPLAALLKKPGMRGHAMTKLEPLYDREREKRRRTGPLREIVLARALYRCGDHEHLGETILKEYQDDVRGLFARHATAVLGGKGR
ncbi:MAG: FAD-dependent oxidoreductase, partial [Planctomycetota bacterium]